MKKSAEETLRLPKGWKFRPGPRGRLSETQWEERHRQYHENMAALNALPKGQREKLDARRRKAGIDLELLRRHPERDDG